MDAVLPSTDYKTELEAEILGLLMDLFMTLFQTIYQKKGGAPRDLFFESEMFGTKVPVCEHPQICEYIEFCSKKLSTLLVTDLVEGFQLNLIDTHVVVQRFVFKVSGKLAYEGLGEAQGEALLKTMAVTAKETVEKFLKMDSLLKDVEHAANLTVNRFQIVLGLTDQAAETYETHPHGIFQGDPDMDRFPWSRPKRNPEVALLEPTHNPMEAEDPGSAPPSPKQAKKILRSKLGTQKLPETSDDPSSPQFIPTLKKGKTGYETPAIVPISTFVLGGLKVVSYSVTYFHDPRVPKAEGPNPRGKASAGSKKRNLFDDLQRKDPLKARSSTETSDPGAVITQKSAANSNKALNQRGQPTSPPTVFEQRNSPVKRLPN